MFLGAFTVQSKHTELSSLSDTTQYMPPRVSTRRSDRMHFLKRMLCVKVDKPKKPAVPGVIPPSEEFRTETYFQHRTNTQVTPQSVRNDHTF
jgi:hypothetical protein